jgi:hypothetical protein
VRCVHELKTWPEPFGAMSRGEKRYEVRVDDRGFRVGDLLHLREWEPATQAYTGWDLLCLVTYKTSGGSFGLPKELCVLGTRIVARTEIPQWLSLHRRHGFMGQSVEAREVVSNTARTSEPPGESLAPGRPRDQAGFDGLEALDGNRELTVTSESDRVSGG